MALAIRENCAAFQFSKNAAVQPNNGNEAALPGAEMGQLYWQALTRDVAFTDYGTSPLIQAACQDLSRCTAFKVLRRADGSISSALLFRANFARVLTRTYISQFPLQPIPTLSTWIEQRYRVPVAGSNFPWSRAETRPAQRACTGLCDGRLVATPCRT